MLERRINLKKIAQLWNSLKKQLTLCENLKNVVHLGNPIRCLWLIKSCGGSSIRCLWLKIEEWKEMKKKKKWKVKTLLYVASVFNWKSLWTFHALFDMRWVCQNLLGPLSCLKLWRAVVWRRRGANLWRHNWTPVSYTHLTLPTKA